MRLFNTAILFLLFAVLASAQHVPSAGVMSGVAFMRQRFTLPSGKQLNTTQSSATLVFQADVPLNDWLSLTVQWANSKLASKQTLPGDAWSPDGRVRYEDNLSPQNIWLMSVPVSLKLSPFPGDVRPYASAGVLFAVLSGTDYLADSRRTWNDDPNNPRFGFPEEIVCYRNSFGVSFTAALGIEYVASSSLSVLFEGDISTVSSPLKDDHFTVQSWPVYHPADNGGVAWKTLRYEIRTGIALH